MLRSLKNSTGNPGFAEPLKGLATCPGLFWQPQLSCTFLQARRSLSPQKAKTQSPVGPGVCRKENWQPRDAREPLNGSESFTDTSEQPDAKVKDNKAQQV